MGCGRLESAKNSPRREARMRLSQWLLAAMCVGLLPGVASALDLGDAAPKLSVTEWVKGAPVSLSDGKGKTVYVLEFWATWCHPCRDSIPHLTELQARYPKEVVVIGVSNEETSDVRPFVEKLGKEMEYRIAVDSGNATTAAYGSTPGFFGIPFAVVIDQKGQIAWYGHPMAGMDEVVGQLVAGKYDVAAIKRAKAAQKLVPKYFDSVNSGDATGAAKLGEQILSEGAADPGLLNEFAWTILTHAKVKTRDLPLALRVAKAAYDTSEGKDAAITDTYARALFDTGDVAGAIEYQKKAIGICTSKRLLPELKATLEGYQQRTTAKP
jgi:thiol-disulfide isomerase/thioredoxin